MWPKRTDRGGGAAGAAALRRAASVLLLLAAAAAAEDWPNWRGPRYDGISRETDWDADWPGSGPRQLWTTRVGIGFSSLTVAAGRVYTLGWKDGQDTVWCLDAETGRELWRYSYPAGRWEIEHPGGPASTPAVRDGKVYTLSRDGLLLCLSADEGKVIWQRNIRKEFKVAPRPSEPPRDYGYSGSPLILGKLLILEVGGPDASTVAFEKDTGKVVWAAGNDGAGYGTPAPITLDGVEHLAVFSLQGPVILRTADGNQRSRIKWVTQFGNNACTPIVSDAKMAIHSAYGMGCALFDLSGPQPRLVWRSRAMQSRFASSALYNGYLYGFDQLVLTCLDFSTGQTCWTKSGFGEGTVLVAGDKLLALSDRGILVVAETAHKAFTPISIAKALRSGPCWTVPVMSGGRIYCRSAAGELVCLDVRKRSPATAPGSE